MDNRSKQRPYSTIQFAAFFDGDLPPAERFEPVLCKSLAADSISFFWNGRTEHSQLVITVGSPLGQLFMAAKVVRETAVFLDGKEMHRIECEFVRRIEGQYRWDAATKAVVPFPVETGVLLP